MSILTRKFIGNPIPEWKKRQEHHEEIERCMEATGSTFKMWNGKETWPLIIECGHTSLDFDKCDCKN